MEKFSDRKEAGAILANRLQKYKNQPNVLILALPRGGVPVGYEIAKKLAIPLDILLVRKLGFPTHKELAIGAIASGGAEIFNEDLITGIKKSTLDEIITEEKEELLRREIQYRGYNAFASVQNKTVILVDDGVATGATIRVAIKAIKQLNPDKIVIAIPVAQNSIYLELKTTVDEIICILHPDDFQAVGLWYDEFEQVDDDTVIRMLAKNFTKINE